MKALQSNNSKVVSLYVSRGAYISFIQYIVENSLLRISSYVCVANVHMCIEAYDDPAFAQVVNGADLITPDGMPLAKAIKVLYGEDQDRVAGMDLLPDLLQEAEHKGLSCFVYGGSEKMLTKSKEYIETKYPVLRCGFYSPPFRPLTAEEEQADVDRINAFGAHLVFVALGCPKQEKWMARMKGRIQACMIGIGGALPVMVGMQNRAPAWMQNASLEWLYRLMQEPKRLFKRYAYTNTKFLYLLFKQKLGILK
ncbi:WecB/TagA/CpsF family glycosyltransferase [Sphingobacterium sp. DN00404]|uniref:WecB/TagA/CpsF family glycosyltransferase n=1 Tax=Sphingobacterium micropteri TaxID=2763501 RepID=A0ABR7YKB0_9SPHI|nr:WecB/TagA/CpsF family glycosyltransferase [Sphingobacterium micropteri]MBD1431750.1 WecB/TagA/CpsF family glycosyltransferase [Sphingobacterium micropteri]